MSICASKPDKAYGSHRHSPASVLYRMWRHPLTGQSPRHGDEEALATLAANGVVNHSCSRRGVYGYSLVPRVAADLYAMSARIAGGGDYTTEDTRALAAAIVAHTPCSLDADLAAAAAAAAEEYEGYSRSGMQRVFTADEITRHVHTYHHMACGHKSTYARTPVAGSLADPEEAA